MFELQCCLLIVVYFYVFYVWMLIVVCFYIFDQTFNRMLMTVAFVNKSNVNLSLYYIISDNQMLTGLVTLRLFNLNGLNV